MTVKDIVGLNEFLQTEKVAVLALPIDDKRTIHSAALLFAPTGDLPELIFITGRDTEKCRMLQDGQAVKASCAIGTSKGIPFSMQMRGMVKLIEYDKAKTYLDAYELKFGKRVDDMSESNQVVLVFAPSWARVTDYVSENFKDGFKRIQLDVA